MKHFVSILAAMFIGFLSMSSASFAFSEVVQADNQTVDDIDLNTIDDQGEMKILITHSDVSCIKGAGPDNISYVVTPAVLTPATGGGTVCDPLGSVAVAGMHNQ